MKSDVQTEVEAALLNSQGVPWDEVLSALCGVIRFARNEFGATDAQLQVGLVAALEDPRASPPV